MSKLVKIIPPGMEECPACDGKGYGYWSCCGGDKINEDMPMCPQCHEHLGEEECFECDGTGLVPLNSGIPTSTEIDLIGRAEARVEAERDWIADMYPSGPAWTGD